jgi:hypothetical protein
MTPSIHSAFRRVFTRYLGFGISAFALAAAGCIQPVEARPDYRDSVQPPSEVVRTSRARTRPGTLTLEWTLDGRQDARVCDAFGGDTMELIVYDDAGDDIVTVTPFCDEFSAEIDLEDGVYGLDATLLDRRGGAVTTTFALDDIDVYAGEETLIPMDFPSDSRL